MFDDKSQIARQKTSVPPFEIFSFWVFSKRKSPRQTPFAK